MLLPCLLRLHPIWTSSRNRWSITIHKLLSAKQPGNNAPWGVLEFYSGAATVLLCAFWGLTSSLLLFSLQRKYLRTSPTLSLLRAACKAPPFLSSVWRLPGPGSVLEPDPLPLSKESTFILKPIFLGSSEPEHKKKKKNPPLSFPCWLGLGSPETVLCLRLRALRDWEGGLFVCLDLLMNWSLVQHSPLVGGGSRKRLFLSVFFFQDVLVNL